VQLKHKLYIKILWGKSHRMWKGFRGSEMTNYHKNTVKNLPWNLKFQVMRHRKKKNQNKLIWWIGCHKKSMNSH